jgi:hypothetical protein
MSFHFSFSITNIISFSGFSNPNRISSDIHSSDLQFQDAIPKAIPPPSFSFSQFGSTRCWTKLVSLATFTQNSLTMQSDALNSVSHGADKRTDAEPAYTLHISFDDAGNPIATDAKGDAIPITKRTDAEPAYTLHISFDDAGNPIATTDKAKRADAEPAYTLHISFDDAGNPIATDAAGDAIPITKRTDAEPAYTLHISFDDAGNPIATTDKVKRTDAEPAYTLHISFDDAGNPIATTDKAKRADAEPAYTLHISFDDAGNPIATTGKCCLIFWRPIHADKK